MSRRGNSPQKRQDALLALAGARGNPASTSALPKIIFANVAVALASAFSPNVPPGALMLALDITPVRTGLLVVSALLNVQTSAPDTCDMSLEYVDLLTAITGGVLIAPGITSKPASTTPADTTNPPKAVGAAATAVVNAQNIATFSFPSVPVQAVAGHRSLIAFRAFSFANTVWTVGGTISVFER